MPQMSQMFSVALMSTGFQLGGVPITRGRRALPAMPVSSSVMLPTLPVLPV